MGNIEAKEALRVTSVSFRAVGEQNEQHDNVPISNVDPLVYSEVLRDLAALA